jgi:hypothetical protein
VRDKKKKKGNCIYLTKSDLEHVDKKIEDLRDRYGGIDTGQWTEMEYLISPLVLLLKLATEEGKISFGVEMNDWGRLGSFREFLKSLQLLQMPGEGEWYWPGLPSCILSLVSVWTSHQIVISASNDRFDANNVIRKAARRFRIARLSIMQKSCTSMVDNMVSKLLSRSNTYTFKELYEALRTVPVVGYITDQEISSTMNQSRLTRIHLPGIVVNWSPSGTYKPKFSRSYI